MTSPKNFVRLCKRRSEFESIVNEALNFSGKNWEKQLIKRVIDYIVGEKHTGVSVYRAETLDPFDHGHALAVVAEGISQRNFRSTSKRRKNGCTRGSLIIPITCLPVTTDYKSTPENNLNFFPANNYHFDLTITHPEEFAKAILNGIHQREIAWSFLGNEKPKGSYRLQAAIAYSYCLENFGKLDPKNPPYNWKDGEEVTVAEQIDTLKHLAGTQEISSP